MTKTIEELRERVSDLKAKLAIAVRALNEAEIAATGIEVGQIVKMNGREYKVTMVRPWYGGKPWLCGVARKRNGEWGTQKRNLYTDWTHPETSKT